MSCAIKNTATAGRNTSYPSLQETAARIGRVSSLPHVAVQIMDVVNKPNLSASDLEKIVLMDPSLAARILSIVNSAAYRARTEIRSVQHAISYLGFKTVRNVAFATALAAVFHDDDKAGGYCRRSLWRHLVSVGVASRMIAARVGLRNAEDAFLAGLLHDFGIILMDQNCHSHFVSMLESLAPDETLPQAEIRCFGFTHAELGAAVAGKWHLPAMAIAGMLHHHDAQGCADENKEIVEVLELANFLCTSKGMPSVGNVEVEPPSDETLRSLSIDREDFPVLSEELDGELDKAATLAQA